MATEPYFTDGTVTLYHGDCRELLPELREALWLAQGDLFGGVA